MTPCFQSHAVANISRQPVFTYVAMQKEVLMFHNILSKSACGPDWIGVTCNHIVIYNSCTYDYIRVELNMDFIYANVAF